MQAKHYSYQVKLPVEHLPEERLRELNAKRIGRMIHEDAYFIPTGQTLARAEKLIRIRNENGLTLVFTLKGRIAHPTLRAEWKEEHTITPEDISILKDTFTLVRIIRKTRTVYLYDSVIINLDSVENLGNFIEFEVQGEEESYKIDALIKLLNLEETGLTKKSYFELLIEKDRSFFNRFG